MTRIAAGAGKSTTISCLCGMIQATSGSASMYGMNLRTQLNGIRRSMGVCPQFDILWPDLTVAEHVRFSSRRTGFFWAAANLVMLTVCVAVEQVNLVCAIKGIPRSEWLAEAERCLTQVDLHEKLTCRTKALSGGQKRKLSVALAFIGAPRIVFLDEPTSGANLVMAARSTRGCYPAIPAMALSAPMTWPAARHGPVREAPHMGGHQGKQGQPRHCPNNAFYG